MCWDDDSQRFQMLVTARANHGPGEGRGVIGHTWSADLRSWQAGPPLSGPGEFAQREVPQLVRVGGAWRILFSAWPRDHSAARLARPGVVAEGGTHYLVSGEKFGRYALDRDAFLVGGGRELHRQRAVGVDGQRHRVAELAEEAPVAAVGPPGDEQPAAVAADEPSGVVAAVGVADADQEDVPDRWSGLR